MFKQHQPKRKKTKVIPPVSNISCMTSHILSKHFLSFTCSQTFHFPQTYTEDFQAQLQSWQMASLKITSNCLNPSSCGSTGITIRQNVPGETELFCKIYSGPMKYIYWIIYKVVELKLLKCCQRCKEWIFLFTPGTFFFLHCHSFPEKAMIS